ncbi:MAG: hydrogenase iron-sulfur subunit, partial [Proteobacteria bacterium]|nr:hydrogenase iron-sulfur subunit [Pseudomonadota bacterium]
MQLNRWGAYFCYSDADRKVDADKFENFAPNVTVGTESEYDILDFAKKVKERGWEHLIVSDCNEPVRFYEHIKGTQIHFLDLQEKCFRPHIDSDQAHNKALQMLRTEMRLAQIKAKTSIPVNLLRAGGGITIYTDQVEGLKLANILKDLDGLKVVIPTNAKDIVPPKDFHGKKADLISVTGRLGALNMTMETDPGFIRLPQKKVQYQTDQLIILTQTPPPNIKKRTGVYLCPDLEKISLENIAIQVRALVGTFKKEEHLKYNSDICAGGEKELNGCERCITACPYDAISRDDTNTLRVKVEHMACEGCGGCVAACPTSSLTYLKPSSEEIYTRIATLQNPPLNDEIAAPEQMILFHCEEMGKKTLQHAGQVPLSYSANILPVEVPCLRYVSEANMLAALKMGAAGVGLLGCENCTHGERDLLYQKYEFARMILHHFDLGEDRIRIITAEEGEEEEVIEIINRFNTQLHKAVFPSEGKSPFKTGNREVLAQILAGF